jgi:mitochondrial distribution and morphology protein 12
MSIDLDWEKLDASLSSSLVDLLNRQLANTPRPSFIGPVEVTSLDFGSVAPDVELVDLRDIYRDFLEASDDEDDPSDHEEGGRAMGLPVKVTEGAPDEDAFEWVSRRATRTEPTPQDLPSYHHTLLPPHGPRRPRNPFVPQSAGGSRDVWNGTMSLPTLVDFGPAKSGEMLYAHRRSGSQSVSGIGRPSATPMSSLRRGGRDSDDSLPSLRHTPSTHPPASHDPPDSQPNAPSDSELQLQLHLHATWHSDLRITLTTSLLINYPSPMFMSLPIKLSVTGLVFTGEIVVAYECGPGRGDAVRRRLHLCVLDDLDPYGPAGERASSKRESGTATPSPELSDETSSSSSLPQPPQPLPAPPTSRSGKPLPAGQRLLPNIFIESEIGQADKHVLKNVTRVERFIQDVIRKTVEEELVFPNFHTLLMADS